MKLIKPYFEIIEQESWIRGIYKQIELAGRTCYKSEDKITPDSAKGFVDRMIKSGHGAMLEHGTVYLKVPVNIDIAPDFLDDVATWTKCKLVQENTGNWWAITTNYRRIIECNYLDHLKYICEPTEYHEKRVCVRFVCDRGVSHEFVRHRVFSFAQESTRYCNYSKDKFNDEITYICPCWLDFNRVQELTVLANKDNKEVYRMGHDDSLSMEERGLCSFIYDMSNHEHGYMFQIQAGWKPQEARAVLPNALKTELVMTGFISDWKHFFELRCDKAAHPQARELAIPLQEEFIKRGYIYE